MGNDKRNRSAGNRSPYQLLRPLTDKEYSSLKRDIELHGVLVAVEVDERGAILDGHHRTQICEELGISDYPRVIRVGLTEQEKRSHVRSLNLHRRHLTHTERQNLIVEQLRDTPSTSNLKIAKTLGVSDKTVATIRARLERRSEIPNVAIRVDTKGRRQPARRPSVITADGRQAKRVLEALALAPGVSLPVKVLDVKRVERLSREHRAREGAKLLSDKPAVFDGGRVELRCGDFREALSDLAEGSVRMVLTDPPYGSSYLPLWSDLGRFCARVLEPGGVLVTYSGQAHLPEVLSALSGHLTYVWVLAQRGSGPKYVNYASRVNSDWKPILVFSKVEYKPKGWVGDLFGGRHEKDIHAWQQSVIESEYLVEAFSSPGDLVVDTCLGSGTNAVGCYKLKRRFIGADEDAEAVAASLERVAQLVTA